MGGRWGRLRSLQDEIGSAYLKAMSMNSGATDIYFVFSFIFKLFWTISKCYLHELPQLAQTD